MAVERNTHLFVALHSDEDIKDMEGLIAEAKQILSTGLGDNKRLTIECDSGKCYKITYNETVNFDEEK